MGAKNKSHSSIDAFKKTTIRKFLFPILPLKRLATFAGCFWFCSPRAKEKGLIIRGFRFECLNIKRDLNVVLVFRFFKLEGAVQLRHKRADQLLT